MVVGPDETTKKGNKGKRDGGRPSTPGGVVRGRLRPQNEEVPEEQLQSRGDKPHSEHGFDVQKGLLHAGKVGRAVASAHAPGELEDEIPTARPPAPAPAPIVQERNLISRVYDYCHLKFMSCAATAFSVFRFNRGIEESPITSSASERPIPEKSDASTLSSHPSLRSGPLDLSLSSETPTSTDTEPERSNRPQSSSLRRPLILPMPSPPRESPMEVSENAHRGGSAPQLGEARQREEAELREDDAVQRTTSARGRMQTTKPRDTSDPSVVPGRRYSKRIRRMPASDPDDDSRGPGSLPPKPHLCSGKAVFNPGTFDTDTIKSVKIKVQQPTPREITASIIYKTNESDSDDGDDDVPPRKSRSFSPDRVSDNASDTSDDESSDDASDATSEYEPDDTSEDEAPVASATQNVPDASSDNASDTSDESDSESNAI